MLSVVFVRSGVAGRWIGAVDRGGVILAGVAILSLPPFNGIKMCQN